MVRKGEYHEKTGVAKYKSLVEVRDSLPDLLKATLEDKERRREERKDLRKARNKRVWTADYYSVSKFWLLHNYMATVKS